MVTKLSEVVSYLEPKEGVSVMGDDDLSQVCDCRDSQKEELGGN